MKRLLLTLFEITSKIQARFYSSIILQEYAYIHDEENVPDGFQDMPFLESLSNVHLEKVLDACTILKCDPGDTIINEGDPASRIYILISGDVAVERGGDEIVVMNSIGDIFGELAALEDEVRSASVISKTESYCLAVDQKFLEHLMPKETNPEFYASLYEFIAKLTTKRLKATSAYLAQVDEERRSLIREVESLKKS